MISASVRRASSRGARPPTVGTSTISTDGTPAASAAPKRRFKISASRKGVRRPAAMSLDT